MYILGIETTGKVQSVSLISLEDKKIILSKVSSEERSHLKMLIPMISDLLNEACVKKDELKYIAVSVGPGSFTGIRIGVATARAIGESLNIKIIPVPTLDSFLCKKEAINSISNAVIIYARRRQVYGFLKVKDKYILEPKMYILDEILDEARKLDKVKFFGDGIDFYKSDLDDIRFELSNDRYQTSVDIVNFAIDNLDLAVSYNDVHPMYMKESEAEEKLRKGELKISHMRQD